MTWWVYAISFDDREISRNDLIEEIDEMPEIGNWYTCMPTVVFVVASISASELSKKLREKIDIERFLVLDVDTDRNGRLTKAAWKFMNDAKPYNRR
jgi:hypothetical protein